MRKLLQNKAVVACLAVVALLSIAGNLVQWPAARTLPVGARAIGDVVAVDPADFPLRAPLQIERTLAGARESLETLRPARDPFSPVRLAVAPSAQGPSPATTPAVPPSFLVQAISIEADKSLVVINRQVLALGEAVDGYVVERIEPKLIRLRGPAGVITVPIGPVPRRDLKPPAAK